MLIGRVMYIMDVRFSKNSLGKLFKIGILKEHLPGEWHLVFIRDGYIVVKRVTGDWLFQEDRLARSVEKT